MKLKTLVKKIESKYPLDLAYDWDNVGLLVGDFDMDVKKVLVVLEANEKVIKEAIEESQVYLARIEVTEDHKHLINLSTMHSLYINALLKIEGN